MVAQVAHLSVRDRTRWLVADCDPAGGPKKEGAPRC